MNRVIRESFDQIRADGSLIEGTIERLKEQRKILEQSESAKSELANSELSRSELATGESMSCESLKTEKKKGRMMSVFSLATVAAACLIIGIFLGSQFKIGNIGIGQSPIAYISIDVNPSIEICLNKNDKVICADAWNSDGQSILSCVDLKGKNCLDAVGALLGCEEFQPYLTEDCALHITVIGQDDFHAKELEQLLRNSDACRRYNGNTCISDLNLYDEAHEHEMSFGKYLLYKELHELDPTVTPEDCHDMTIKEMENRICDHENGHVGSHDSTHDTTHNTMHEGTQNMDASHHAESSSHEEKHATETHTEDTHSTDTHSADVHGAETHDTQHHDTVQSVPQQEVHHEEEHHQTSQQIPVVPQTPVQTPCDVPSVQEPSCPEPPCETPVVTETPCPDSSGTGSAGNTGDHDGGHESGGHHGENHH